MSDTSFMPHCTRYTIYTACNFNTIVSVNTYQWIKIYPVLVPFAMAYPAALH